MRRKQLSNPYAAAAQVASGLPWGKIAVAGGATFVFFKYVKPWLDKMQAKADLKTDQESTVKSAPGKKLFDLNGKPINSANLSTIAADIHDALSFPADEERAIRVFLSTPFGYVQKLEQFYLDRYGDNMKQKMIDKFSDAQWIRVKFWFR